MKDQLILLNTCIPCYYYEYATTGTLKIKRFANCDDLKSFLKEHPVVKNVGVEALVHNKLMYLINTEGFITVDPLLQNISYIKVNFHKDQGHLLSAEVHSRFNVIE